MFVGSWCLGLTTSPPSVSRLFRQYGILNISQPIRLQALLRDSLFYFIIIIIIIIIIRSKTASVV
jgi:hypothetical protein